MTTVLKINLKEIVKYPNYTLPILENAIRRTNLITRNTYYVLRFWVLQKYHSNTEIPIITTDTISMCMKSLLLPSRGPKPKLENQSLFNEFKNIHNFKLTDGSGLKNILQYYATTILTSIQNNITLHYKDYVKRFVNGYFKDIYSNLKTKESIQKNTIRNQKRYF